MFEFLKKNSISIEDVNILNQDIINYIVGEGEDYFLKKNKKIIVENLDSTENIAKRIDEDGIVVIPNFLDSSYCQDLENFIVKIINVHKDKLSSGLFFEDEIALIQHNKTKLSGYANLKNYNKSVINIRSGLDEGMIDIFNIDRLNIDLFEKIKEFVKSDFFTKLFSQLKIGGTCSNVNAYINDGIMKTRGFHADSYTKQYKVFFYLTDVLSLENGPYTYVCGTHKKSSYRKINQSISSKLNNSTETPVLPYTKIHPILGYKGSLVISNQSGFHRGFPQQNNSHRIILSLNIT